MNDDIKKVAIRLREMREIDGKTTEDLARYLGITNEKYLEYESGAVDMPISFLSEVAAYFGVQFTNFSPETSRALKCFSTLKAERA